MKLMSEPFSVVNISTLILMPEIFIFISNSILINFKYLAPVDLNS